MSKQESECKYERPVNPITGWPTSNVTARKYTPTDITKVATRCVAFKSVHN